MRVLVRRFYAHQYFDEYGIKEPRVTQVEAGQQGFGQALAVGTHLARVQGAFFGRQGSLHGSGQAVRGRDIRTSRGRQRRWITERSAAGPAAARFADSKLRRHTDGFGPAFLLTDV